MKTIRKRVQSATPPFFRKVRKWGLVTAGISAAMLTAPVALPAVLVKAAGYLAVAASVASAVSQTAVKGE